MKAESDEASAQIHDSCAVSACDAAARRTAPHDDHVILIRACFHIQSIRIEQLTVQCYLCFYDIILNLLSNRQ